jgi:hypothetical protein
MDEPLPQQEQPDEQKQTVTPAEVWEQLSPDLQERIVSLLGRMAYKYALAQCGSISEGTEAE